MSQPPSSENPMDSIWDRDSISWGSASAKRVTKAMRVSPGCSLQPASTPCLQGWASFVNGLSQYSKLLCSHPARHYSILLLQQTSSQLYKPTSMAVLQQVLRTDTDVRVSYVFSPANYKNENNYSWSIIHSLPALLYSKEDTGRPRAKYGPYMGLFPC